MLKKTHSSHAIKLPLVYLMITQQSFQNQKKQRQGTSTSTVTRLVAVVIAAAAAAAAAAVRGKGYPATPAVGRHSSSSFFSFHLFFIHGPRGRHKHQKEQGKQHRHPSN